MNIKKYKTGMHPNSRNGFKKGHPDLVPLEARKRAGLKTRGRPNYKLRGKANCGKGLTLEQIYGKEKVLEIKRKQSIARKGKYNGENHPAWRGGISFEPYGLEFNDELKEQIKKRDNYTCQECGYTKEQLKWNLFIHHIDYDKQNNNPNNLITLCNSCHF